MDKLTLLGLTATIFTTGAFLPQVIKAWKTKHTKDLSLPMYLILITGITLWFIYGFFRKDVAVMAANGSAGLLVLSIIYLKIRNG